MTVPMMPGECHPALTEFAPVIRTTPPAMDRILVAETPPPSLSFDDALTLGPPTRTLALRRERASFTLYPQYGAYVWDVWVDEHGRQIAGEEATWWAHPGAVYLPPFGHGPLQTPEQAAAERRDRAAARDREYLEALTRDYVRGMVALAAVLVLVLLIGAFL